MNNQIKAESINQDSHNANKGTERGKELLTESIQKLGFGRSIVLDSNNQIICGNKTFENAVETGLKNVIVVETDGNQLVAVKRKDLDLDTDGDARALAYADNKVGQDNLDWDLEVLKEDFENGIELFGFDEAELDDMFAELDSLQDEENQEGSDDDDRVPHPSVHCVSKPGDIFILGNHRLLCGDCRTEDNVQKLLNGNTIDSLVTDPPYGVDYSSKNEFLNTIDKGNRNQTPINNDAIDDYVDFFSGFLSNIPFSEYNTAYIFMSGRELHSLRLAADKAGLTWSSWLVWNKNNHVLGRTDYAYKHEFLYYGWKGRHKFYGDFSTTVIDFPKPQKSEEHPTMKPVGLLCKLLKDGSRPDMNVYDPFCGSGSTLIACEKMNRNCYGIELEPHYCDVIINRWQEYSGKQAVLESSGKTFTELQNERQSVQVDCRYETLWAYQPENMQSIERKMDCPVVHGKV